MHITHLRHLFYLHGKKIAVLGLLLLLLCTPKAFSQRNTSDNLPSYDERWLHYGFLVGIHTSTFRVQYSDQFLDMDSLHSVMPANSFGFSLGLIANLRLAQYLDLRLMPEVVFYQHKVDYNYISNGQSDPVVQTLETTFVEFPILFKYKSVRRDNFRWYLIGGVEPGIDATGKKNKEDPSQTIVLEKSNLSAQFGFGLDLYFPLFKFSPEIRFSRGLVNMMADEDSPYHEPLSKMYTNTVTLYLLFE
jgi:hypothetical protein